VIKQGLDNLSAQGTPQPEFFADAFSFVEEPSDQDYCLPETLLDETFDDIFSGSDRFPSSSKGSSDQILSI